MISINTNLSSLIAQNSLNTSTNKLNETLERMSSGYKINHAKDNAANYSISTNMTTKIGAYSVAQDNAAMGLDMVTTASETINEMQNHATRLRALATQARNGTYGAQSLKAIQEEANALVDEIDRLYNTAKFNGISLFNQKEYDIPDNMPKADPVTGFIENPYDYTKEALENITSISEVKNNTFTENIYKIETADELAKLAKLTNDGVDTTGKTFVLANDIDLTEYCEKYKDDGGWTPIGTETNRFKGTFNGNGNIISNLTINRATYDSQGLFGVTSNTSCVENLGIINSYISGKNNIGLLIGKSYSGVKNCFAKGDITGNDNIGLLCGVSTSSVGCFNSYSIGDIISSGNWIGGLIGSCWSSISNCYTNVNIESKGEIVGGMIGILSIGKGVENSYSIGNISAKTNVGGLAGYVNAQSSTSKNVINNCIANCNIKGNQGLGSFIGRVNLKADDTTMSALEVNDCKSLLSQDLEVFGVIISGGNTYSGDTSHLLSEIEIVSPKKITTNLQIGIKSESNSQINYNTNFEYNLGRIKRDGIDSHLALSLIDNFTDLLSSKQTELGSVSNRLESVLDEISTQYDNLVSSRSTLRDADMAELSSTYIQQQILQEASATLMATANQMPAIALQLL